MSCFNSLPPEERENAKRSRDIDRLLQLDKNRQEKLLLLGPGESGKSTFFKQMKLLQDDNKGGFDKEERESYKAVVLINCVTQMKVLLAQAKKANLTLSPANQEIAASFLQMPSSSEYLESNKSSIYQQCKSLWADPVIKQIFEKRDEFQLNDSADHFFNNIDKFSDPSYLPDDNDILRVRVRTCGIEEASFRFRKFEFRMTDVGGQRTERRKWIHCFDCVTAVIFVTAASEYNQTLREDANQNRMKESLSLFGEIINYQTFNNASIILFLNKVDLFQEKIKKFELKNYFPNYTGGSDFKSAIEFVKKQFLAMNYANRKIFVHETCAVDSQNVFTVFASVRETVLDKNLEITGV